MSAQEEIRERLKRLAGDFGPAASMLGEVVSVDEAEGVCVINDGDIDVYDVRLRPVITANQGVTLFPAVGSFVLAIRIEQSDEWLLIAAEKIDKCRVVVGNIEAELDGEKVLLKKGSDDAKKLLNDFIDAVKNLKLMTNTGVTISLTAASLTTLTEIDERINELFKS
jgi:hypothetical protein